MANSTPQESDSEYPHEIRNHDHTLRLCNNRPRYKCGGCKENGEQTGYWCPSCRDFTLHPLCGFHEDEVDHPFEGPATKLRFHLSTTGNHRCKVCKESIKGFVFRSEGVLNRFNAHPLCIDLPKNHLFSGHRDHELTLQAQKDEFECNFCKKKRRGWRYTCEREDYQVEVRCIMKDLQAPVKPCSRRKRDVLWKGFKYLSKCAMSVGATAGSAIIADEIGNRGNDGSMNQ